MNVAKGLTVVVSGPSGVGKGTVVSLLKAELPDIEECVTCTTRQPRQGERDRIDYYFITAEEFERRKNSGYFLEYAFVHGNYYGTPREEVEALTGKGKTVLLEIDVQGGINVKKAMPDSLTVFLMPPSPEALFKRLSGRGTETEEAIALRTKNARWEMEQAGLYDAVVVNDDLRRCADRVKELILCKRNGK
ncbi:MAG: guanylate kinase [Abditibacteriota bacterium]|nr:guanylate kinase [Abditibacteriota bacterium]